MPKVNIYLSEQLADAVRVSRVSVSPVCQHALEREVHRMRNLDSVLHDIDEVAARLSATQTAEERALYDAGVFEGIQWARDEATLSELVAMAQLAGRGRLEPPVEVDSALVDNYEALLRDGTLMGGPALEAAPFWAGLADGASQVFEAVRPLLNRA